MNRAVFVLALLITLPSHALQVSVSPTETLEIAERSAVVKIDGKLDEAVWASLDQYDEFVVIEPDTLVKPAHATWVSLFYNQLGLYVGVQVEQPPETRIARLSSRDNRQIKRDSVGMVLDTSGEGRYGYWFGINLGDAQMDGTLLPEKQFTSDWDGAWEGATSETQTGWTAEMFIPWGVVSMPKQAGARRIGLYMERFVAYKDERWSWPALPDTVPQFISALQSVSVKDVQPKQQYSIFPSASVTQDQIDGKTNYRAGADFFWRPSTNLQLTATINPDFGVAESDDVVINLSATETFFPEKRLFFLEGQDVFTASPRADTRGAGVGNRGAPYTLVNTRRIGGKPVLPVLGAGESARTKDQIQPNDLLGAVKVTGQNGQIRYGVLAAFEDDPEFLVQGAQGARRVVGSGSEYGVARILFEDQPGGAYKSVGALSTMVLNEAGDALVQSLDGHYLGENGKFKADAQVFTSDKDGVDRGFGGFVDFEYAFRQGVTQRLGIEYFDDAVDVSDLGFLQRNDNFRIRQAHTRTRSDLSWARSNQLDIRGFVQKNSEDLFTQGGLFVSNQSVLNNLSQVVFRLDLLAASYDDLNSFGNGAYRVEARQMASIGWASNRSKPLSFGGKLGYQGEELGGDSAVYSLYATWRPDDRLVLDLMFNYLDRSGWLLHSRDRTMGTFDAEQWAPGIGVEYFISAKQQLKFVVQWVGVKARARDAYGILDAPGHLQRRSDLDAGVPDFAVSQVSLQGRYRWEIAPLSDLFVVYTRQSNQSGLLLQRDFQTIFSDSYQQPVTDAFVVKLRYRFGS